MSEHENETNAERLARLAEVASVADTDTEEALLQLQRLAEQRRKDPVVEQKYEALRNQLSRQIGAEGARWFLDAEGNKWLGYTVAPSKTTLDVAEATAMAKKDEITEEVLDLIAPRKQDLAGLKQAIVQKKLTPAQIQHLCSFEPGTPYVQFGQPGSDDQE